MRLSPYPLVLAGASLAVLQAGAAPLRVIVVTSHQEVSSNFAPLHTVPDGAIPAIPIMPMHHDMSAHHMNIANQSDLLEGPGVVHSIGRHCGSLRDKALRLSNKILGFPKIDEPMVPNAHYGHHEPIPNGRVSILPFFGTPTAFGAAHAHDDAEVVPTPSVEMGMARKMGYQATRPSPEMGPVRIVHMNEQDAPRMRFRHHRGPFLRRIHFALMALGPWEGRAVAFVLGCGIGVLLRMVWVLGVVMVRAISGRRSSEDSSEDAMFDVDAKEIIVPPPQYTDEKVALVVDDKPPGRLRWLVISQLS